MRRICGSWKIHLGVIVSAIALFTVIGISNLKAEDGSFKYLDEFHRVYQMIRTEYVEPVDPKVLFQGAIRGMIASLNDPYSRYLDENEYGGFNEEITGKFIGIGVEISKKDDDIVVIAPIDDSPAKKAGIMAGDVIVKIDDLVTRGKDVEEIINQIKGNPDTLVTVYVKRDNIPEPLEFEVKREPIKVSSVKSGIMKENQNVGYLHITHFYADTAVDVDRAIRSFNDKKISKVVLDLRDNPGGDMEAAISIANLFLDKGALIVSTRGREGSGINDEYKAQTGPLYNGTLVLLVNEGSASSSEILSGALKDNKRAKLIGQRTFGKALVQRVNDLDGNKSGFTLTIRKYYTPSGAMIHKKGITPDIELAQYEVPESDRKNLGRAINDKVFEEFAKTHPEYNEVSRTELMAFLKTKNLLLTEKVAAILYKQELDRYKPSPLYDLEFDTELAKALEILK